MSDTLVSSIPTPSGDAEWLINLKFRIHTVQQRAALAANRDLVFLYWQIGRHSVVAGRAGLGGQGDRAAGARPENGFQEMKEFSRANLMYMRAFADAWPTDEIVQQAVG